MALSNKKNMISMCVSELVFLNLFSLGNIPREYSSAICANGHNMLPTGNTAPFAAGFAYSLKRKRKNLAEMSELYSSAIALT
jgi:hypothetical protein